MALFHELLNELIIEILTQLDLDSINVLCCVPLILERIHGLFSVVYVRDSSICDFEGMSESRNPGPVYPFQAPFKHKCFFSRDMFVPFHEYRMSVATDAFRTHMIHFVLRCTYKWTLYLLYIRNLVPNCSTSETNIKLLTRFPDQKYDENHLWPEMQNFFQWRESLLDEGTDHYLREEFEEFAYHYHFYELFILFPRLSPLKSSISFEGINHLCLRNIPFIREVKCKLIFNGVRHLRLTDCYHNFFFNRNIQFPDLNSLIINDLGNSIMENIKMHPGVKKWKIYNDEPHINYQMRKIETNDLKELRIEAINRLIDVNAHRLKHLVITRGSEFIMKNCTLNNLKSFKMFDVGIEELAKEISTESLHISNCYEELTSVVNFNNCKTVTVVSKEGDFSLNKFIFNPSIKNIEIETKMLDFFHNNFESYKNIENIKIQAKGKINFHNMGFKLLSNLDITLENPPNISHPLFSKCEFNSLKRLKIKYKVLGQNKFGRTVRIKRLTPQKAIGSFSAPNLEYLKYDFYLRGCLNLESFHKLSELSVYSVPRVYLGKLRSFKRILKFYYYGLGDTSSESEDFDHQINNSIVYIHVKDPLDSHKLEIQGMRYRLVLPASYEGGDGSTEEEAEEIRSSKRQKIA